MKRVEDFPYDDYKVPAKFFSIINIVGNYMGITLSILIVNICF